MYGPFDNFDPENAMVVPSLIRKAHENPSLDVWGDGSPVRDFIHSRDVALGMLFVVENGITEPLNLGSGTGVSIKELVEIIADNLEEEKAINWDTTKPTGDKMRILDMTKAKSYGFETSISFEEGVKDTIRWFRENRDIIDRRHNAFKK